MSEQKSKEQTSNIITISNSRDLRFFINLAKNFLKTQDVIEIIGLGQAMTGVAQVAEALVGQNYATIEKLETITIDLKQKTGEVVKKTKLRAVIRKTQQFNTLLEENKKKYATEDLISQLNAE